jgi:hypothetical protein
MTPRKKIFAVSYWVLGPLIILNHCYRNSTRPCGEWLVWCAQVFHYQFYFSWHKATAVAVIADGLQCKP